jgi:hypothetical protein
MAIKAQLTEQLNKQSRDLTAEKRQAAVEREIEMRLAQIKEERRAVLGAFALMMHDATTDEDEIMEDGLVLEVNRGPASAPEYGEGTFVTQLRILGENKTPIDRKQLELDERDKLIGGIVAYNLFRPKPNDEGGGAPPQYADAEVGKEEIFQVDHPTLRPQVLNEGAITNAEMAVEALGRQLRVFTVDARNADLNPELASRLPAAYTFEE